jgi:hypothetical protein
MLPALGANIVVNPSFESGFTGWTTHACTDPGCSFPGWSVDAFNPHSGTSAANTGCLGAMCLDPIDGDWIEQTLTTVPLSTYVLSFWLDPGFSNEPNAEIDAYWNGVLVGTFAAQPGGYHQYFITGLLATSSSSVLKFAGRDDPYLLFLDDVEVDIPEPLTSALAGLGLGLLGLLRLRRVR